MFDMLYTRYSPNILFLFPAFAFGWDVEDNLPFFEVAWLSWAIGIGAKE